MTKIMKSATVRLGFPQMSGHGFRRLFITTLVNDPGVNLEESMSAARHSSVSAHRAYMARDSASEVAKFRALGVLVEVVANEKGLIGDTIG